MDSFDHTRTSARFETSAPPRFRTLLLISTAFFAAGLLLLAANLRDAPVASAAHSPTQYNLCERPAVISAAILRELREWGTTNSDNRYEQAQGFGCGRNDHDGDSDTPDQQYTAFIPAADLMAHTDFNGYANRLEIRGLNTVKRGDFDGLNVDYIYFVNPGVTELPARLFDGLTLQEFRMYGHGSLTTIDEDLFEGLTIKTTGNFVIEIAGDSILTADDIPPTLFDPLGDQGFANAAANVDFLSLSGPFINQINTRWFASLAKTGVDGWHGINLAPHWSLPAHLKTQPYDTWYYDEGDGRFLDGTKATAGENNITSSTTKTTLANAISDETKRYAEAKTGSTFTKGSVPGATVVESFLGGNDNQSPLQITGGEYVHPWGYVNICARTNKIRDAIITELKANDGEQDFKGVTTNDIATGTYPSDLGCTASSASYDHDSGATIDHDNNGGTAQVATPNLLRTIIPKADLTAHTQWQAGSTNELDLGNEYLWKLKFDDFRYLDVTHLTFGRNSITEMPEGIFSGLALEVLSMESAGIEKLQSGLFQGIDASGLTSLDISNNFGLSDVNIDPDVFDPLTELRYLNLSTTAIGRVNTRWFKPLVDLGSADSGQPPPSSALVLERTPVTSHFYNESGGYYHSGATNKTDYRPWVSTDAEQLRTAIANAIGNPSTLNLTGSRFEAPDRYGVDPCDRHEVVWKELMRLFQHFNDGGPIVRPTSDQYYQPVFDDHAVGDVRFARYPNIDITECRVLWARWVSKITGEDVALGYRDTSANTLAINIPNAQRLRIQFTLAHADLSRLTPADLENLHDIRKLHLHYGDLTAPRSNLFADMPRMKELWLTGNNLRNSDFTGSSNFLAPLTQLEKLGLSENLLTKFDSEWLMPATRLTLDELHLAGNPIASTDLTGLNLRVLDISGSSVTQLDPAILEMTSLREIYWRELRALPIDGLAEFVPNLPTSIVRSDPGSRLGNPGDLESTELDAQITALQLAHLARLRAARSSVHTVNFSDPCRPPVYDAVPTATATTHIAAWSSNYGNLCLTDAHKNEFIEAQEEFRIFYDRPIRFEIVNLNLSDAQMATFLNKVDIRDAYRLRMFSNPNAFGDGFDNSALDIFENQGNLFDLAISHSDLNYEQANSILRKLEEAFVQDRLGRVAYPIEFGLETLDFSFNQNLFTGVDADDLKTFLRGIISRRDDRAVEVNLRATGLNFNQFQAIVESMRTAEYRVQEYSDARYVRTLDVSDNPELWRNYSDETNYTMATAAEVNDLLSKLPGLTELRVGGTGLTSQATLASVFDAVDHDPETDLTHDPRIYSSLKRLNGLSLSNEDLTAFTAAELRTEFAKLGTRFTSLPSNFRTLRLARTQITSDQLKGIVDGLGSAGLLDGVMRLDLSGNTNALDCLSTGDGAAQLIARFTNLRHLDISATASDFATLECVTDGLDSADGNSRDDRASNVVSLNLRDNPEIFGAQGAKTASADVAAAFAPLRDARVNLGNTGITTAQATAILRQRIAGQSDEEQRATEQAFVGLVPGFAFQTPLPDDARIESGRGSLRVLFTHNPMYNGESFDVLRYEYRYRVRPEQADAGWGDTGTEAWRNTNLDLTTTGIKQFDIFGLGAETIYQVQLRALSIARPDMLTVSGGTTINLPKVNSIKPGITEVAMRAGESVRLEVDIFGLMDNPDNGLFGRDGINLVFAWSDDGGGTFSEPNDGRQVTYTAPGLPGRYEVMAEARPDGICKSHHRTDFGITDADRVPCQAIFTVRVSRAPVAPITAPDPVNPAGAIPTSLTDADGTAYAVFTPLDGGTFTGAGVTVSAAKGAVPDQQLLGVSAAVSSITAPEPMPGALMTIAGSLYDMNAIQGAGQPPVSGYKLDEPLTACLPLPDAFRANLSNIVVVERKADGSYGILTSNIRQTAGDLSVCGAVSTLPATVGVAKLGVVPALPATPEPEVETPDTGATAPSNSAALLAITLGMILLIAAAMLATVGNIRRRRNQSDVMPCV